MTQIICNRCGKVLTDEDAYQLTGSGKFCDAFKDADFCSECADSIIEYSLSVSDLLSASDSIKPTLVPKSSLDACVTISSSKESLEEPVQLLPKHAFDIKEAYTKYTAGEDLDSIARYYDMQAFVLKDILRKYELSDCDSDTYTISLQQVTGNIRRLYCNNRLSPTSIAETYGLRTDDVIAAIAEKIPETKWRDDAAVAAHAYRDKHFGKDAIVKLYEESRSLAEIADITGTQRNEVITILLKSIPEENWNDTLCTEDRIRKSGKIRKYSTRGSLTGHEEEAIKMIASGIKQVDVAKKFDVTQASVSRLVKRYNMDTVKANIKDNTRESDSILTGAELVDNTVVASSKIDIGKVKALRKAGWSLSQIADEFYCDESDIKWALEQN
jgi:predicted transcriptional regulator/predicted HTH domain antitoxin